MLLIKLLKRIVLPTILLFSSIAHAKEIQQQDFLHDFYNSAILYVGYDRKCGTIDEDMFAFIVRGAADFIMDEKDWSLEQAKSFLKTSAIVLDQSVNSVIDKYGCDYFNYIVIENKDDFLILDDAFDIYSLEFAVDSSEITPL